MGYKLIALDIDGTIRGDDHPISSRTRRAIERVAQAGAAVTLATGRMFQSALASAAELNLTSPIVSYQGAHIADPTTGEVLWHRPLTPDMATAALDALATWQGEVLAYYGGQVYVDRLTPWVEGYGQRNRGAVNVVADLHELAGEGLTRLVVVGDEGDIKKLDRSLNASLGSRLHITRSLPHFCEILHRNGGKHNALAWLCRHLGIPRDQTVAFGNGYNDIHMLEWVGLAVAVAGAVPEVLDVAHRVAPPMEEDGAAIVLEELLEQGLVG
jgi:Cof subfamily protein (haloacid dehalogenase superfamily)